MNTKAFHNSGAKNEIEGKMMILRAVSAYVVTAIVTFHKLFYLIPLNCPMKSFPIISNFPAS